jgi:hypothetical protein
VLEVRFVRGAAGTMRILTIGRPSLIIPTSSLVIDHNGMHVVTVSRDGRVHFAPVTIGKDMGAEVEILQGLQASDQLVASPSDLLNEGQTVEVR